MAPCDRRTWPFGAPPAYKLLQPVPQAHVWPPANLRRRPGHICEPPRDRVHRPLGFVDDAHAIHTHHLHEQLGQTNKADLSAVGYVQGDVARSGAGGQDIGARDVVHMHHVQRLQPVAEYYRSQACVDPLHPTDQHLRITPVYIHARAVGVEISQTDVVEAVHVVEAPEESFSECFGRAVKRAVVVWRLALVGGENVRHAVDRGGGGHDHLPNLRGDAGFQQLVSRIDHHLDGPPRLHRALRDAQGREVEDRVAAARQPGDQVAVADVALDEADTPTRQRLSEILYPSPDEIVDNHDLAAARMDELFHSAATDEAGASRHQHFASGEIKQGNSHGANLAASGVQRCPMTRAGLPAAFAKGGTSLVTIAPAPTIAPRPIRTPGRMIAFTPMSASASITTGRIRRSVAMIGTCRGC